MTLLLLALSSHTSPTPPMATLILFLSFLLFTVSPSQVISTRSEEEIKLLFEGWLIKHHKNYNHLFEIEKRYNIFKDNLKFIDEHNAGNHSITLGLTVFADLTNDEYRKTYLGFRQPTGSKMSSKESTNGYHFNGSESLPDSVDWRLKKAVAPVKDQGECNSCWAFSAIAATEGLNAIVTGRLVSLSEQEIIDCHKKSCSTGTMDDAFEFIIANKGIDTEQDYPYRGRYVGYCDKNKLGRKVVSIDGYKDIPSKNELYLKKAVAHQPVSVAVDTDNKYFPFYKSGIFDESCGTNIDHAVTVIGYGSEHGKDYWLIKNSWGQDWGEKGYMRLRRNIQQSDQGKCGITLLASYPVKSSRMNIENPIEEKAVEQISAN